MLLDVIIIITHCLFIESAIKKEEHKMKSAKRIIALIVSAAMLIATLLTVNVFAQDIVFPDVAED